MGIRQLVYFLFIRFQNTSSLLSDTQSSLNALEHIHKHWQKLDIIHKRDFIFINLFAFIVLQSNSTSREQYVTLFL